MTHRVPDYTVLKEGRLVARLYAGAGFLHRAGKPPMREIGWADVELFDPRAEPIIAGLVEVADSLDALLFKLRLEEFRVEPGDVKIGPTMKRF